MIRALLLMLLVLLVPACDDAPDRAPPAQEAVAPDLVTLFLVQAECADAAGVPLRGVLPFEAGCQLHRPATPGQLTYRRLDWSGVQANDALLLPDGRVIQTFDFGDGPRAFGRLDRGLGDGGDLLRVSGLGVGIEQTEDGGAGRQWWRDPWCRDGAGWLLFAGTPGDAWVGRSSQLGMVRDEAGCAGSYSEVWTQWRRTAMTLPWTDGIAGGQRQLDVIVSEHFASGPEERSDHMERFVFAAGLGKVMWERWEHAGRTRREAGELAQAIRAMEGDGRCPVPASAPGAGWLRADCRVWMRFDRGGGLSLPWP